MLKWKHSLNLKTQQLGVDLHAFRLELKLWKKVEQPIVSLEESHTHEDNEVNFDLPPKFNEYEGRENETTEEENQNMCLIAKQEEVMEKTKEGESLVLKNTFRGLEDGKRTTLALSIPSKLPQKSTHNQSVQSSLFHTHNKPPKGFKNF